MATVVAQLRPRQQPEPLLDENADRYCMFPVSYDSLWRVYKMNEVTFWTAEDAALSLPGAAREWATLSPSEQACVARLLCFLSASDQLIGLNICARFLDDIQMPEGRAFYSFQLFKQGIHVEALSGLLVAYLGGDEAACLDVMQEVQALPAVRRKVEWVKQRIHSPESFAERLLAFALVESLFFCTSFAAAYALKRRELLPTLGFVTDMVSRDEGIHVEAGAAVYALLQHKVPQKQVEQMVREAVEIEEEFASQGDGLPLEALGLRLEDMLEYQRYVADRLLSAFGHILLFRARNPFEWLADIALKPPEVKGPKGGAAGSKTASGLTSSQVGLMAAREGAAEGLVFDEDF